MKRLDDLELEMHGVKSLFNSAVDEALLEVAAIIDECMQNYSLDKLSDLQNTNDEQFNLIMKQLEPYFRKQDPNKSKQLLKVLKARLAS